MPPPHHDCDLRYRALLDRLHELSTRVERVERHHATLVDLLDDFRTLIQLVVRWVRALDHRIDDVWAWRLTRLPADERRARHFRN